jgi:hypothetical protein
MEVARTAETSVDNFLHGSTSQRTILNTMVILFKYESTVANTKCDELLRLLYFACRKFYYDLLSICFNYYVQIKKDMFILELLLFK